MTGSKTPFTENSVMGVTSLGLNRQFVSQNFDGNFLIEMKSTLNDHEIRLVIEIKFISMEGE